jgi:hypothetical protein
LSFDDGILDGNLAFIENFGWREAVVLCIVLATIYFVVMVLRFLQLPRPDVYRLGARAPEMRTPPPEFDAPPGSALAGVWTSPPEPRLDAFLDPLMDPRPEPRRESRPDYTLDLHLEASESAAADGDFAAQLTQKKLEAEVRQLRDHLAESREEIQRMREEMGRLSAAQKVSPLYNEAMALAVRGVDAAGVAGRCGISIAEAELVVALSKRPDAG